MAMPSLRSLPDQVLLRELASTFRREDASTVAVLAHLAEVDERRLHAAEGFTSLHDYCVVRLHRSEDAVAKRIQAARTARRFPDIFAMLADGRLHLSGVGLLAPHLTPATAGELLQAAAHKSCAEIRLLLAERFPRADVPTSIRRIGPGPEEHAPQHVDGTPSGAVYAAPHATQHVDGSEPATQPGIDMTARGEATAGDTAPAPAQPLAEGAAASQPIANGEASAQPRPAAGGEAPAPWSAASGRVLPLSPQRYELRATLDEATLDLLRRAQDLLSNAVPPSDMNGVLRRVLETAIPQLERALRAATTRPGRPRGACEGRGVPAAVERAVRQRDGDRCTYEAADGRRCTARHHLELDHVVPVAQGGQATVGNLRIRCRTHNRLAADQAFGARYMAGRVRGAQERRAAKHVSHRIVEQGAGESRKVREANHAEAARERAALIAKQHDVHDRLREMGHRDGDARLAASLCVAIDGAPLEERVRYAASFLEPAVASCRAGTS